MNRKVKKPSAVTASQRSKTASGELSRGIPQTPGDEFKKMGKEASRTDGVVQKLRAVGRELDRDVSGEYERRQDEAAARGRIKMSKPKGANIRPR